MSSIEEQVWELIEKHAGRGGLVNMRRMDRDCADLPIDSEYIDIIIGKIRDAGLVWFYGNRMILVKSFNCPNCGLTAGLLSTHIDECLRLQKKRAQHRASLGV